MSEMPIQQPSYEALKASVPDRGVRESWDAADSAAGLARSAIASVHADERLSDAGKRERIEGILERSSERITERYARARELADRGIESLWKFSVPMPDSGDLATSRLDDPAAIMALNSESQRIQRRLEEESLQAKTRARSKNPRDEGARGMESTARTLRQEYAEGMEMGGTAGRIRTIAGLRLAESTGVGIDPIVEDHRTPRHERYLSEREALVTARASIPGSADLRNPYEGRVGKSGVGLYGTRNRAIIGTGDTKDLFKKKKRKRPAWN